MFFFVNNGSSVKRFSIVLRKIRYKGIRMICDLLFHRNGNIGKAALQHGGDFGRVALFLGLRAEEYLAILISVYLDQSAP